MRQTKNTSWQKVSKWYGSIVGEKGHFYHQSLIIPQTLKLLGLKAGDRLLDVPADKEFWLENSLKLLSM